MVLHDIGYRVLFYLFPPNFNQLSQNNLGNSCPFPRWIFSLEISHVSCTKIFYIGFVADSLILFQLTDYFYIHFCDKLWLKCYICSMNFTIHQHKCLFSKLPWPFIHSLILKHIFGSTICYALFQVLVAELGFCNIIIACIISS